MVLDESAPFCRKLNGSLKNEPGRLFGSSVVKGGKLVMSGSATKPQTMSFENGRKGEQPIQSAEFNF